MKNLWTKLKPIILGWTLKGMITILEQRGYTVLEPLKEKDTKHVYKISKEDKDE